jgi:hypothetical protein
MTGADVSTDSRVKAKVVIDDQDEELQRALQESLIDKQTAKDNAMDEY